MSEVWKPIPGYEGLYEVSNYGRVKSLDRYVTRKGKAGGKTVYGKIKDFGKNNRGYLMVNLYKGNKAKYRSVHRIVAEVFVHNDDPAVKTIVNHKDEDKTNNHADNLEWCDQLYNHTYGTCRERISKSLKQYFKRKQAYAVAVTYHDLTTEEWDG